VVMKVMAARLKEMRSLTLILLLFAIGCRGAMTEAEYATAFKAECERYHSKAKEIAAKPWPQMKGFSREDRRKALAQKVRGDTKIYSELAADFKNLRPPQAYEGVQKAYQEFLDGQVRINNAYAAAIEANDSAGARQRNEEFVAFLQNQMNVVLDEIGKVGVDVAKLKEALGAPLSEGIAETLTTPRPMLF
jgi:hypothetical protein